MVTSLQVTGTPGRGYHVAVDSGEKPPDRVTALSGIATPGGLRLFQPKGVSEVVRDQVTELAAWAIPGKRRRFEAKAPAVVVLLGEDVGGGGSKYKRSLRDHRQRLIKEDQEILAIVMAATKVLHEWGR
jgi:hypothetical protein